MGLLCGVGFMGAPVIEVEKLMGGDETMLALLRLQQVLASGVCEGDGKKGSDQVRVTEHTCEYLDGTQFPTYLASEEDLGKVSTDNVPLV